MSSELEAETAAVETMINEQEKKLAQQRQKVWAEQLLLDEMTSEWKDLVLRLGRLRRGFSDGHNSSTASGSN